MNMYSKMVMNIPIQAPSMSDTLAFIEQRIEAKVFTQHVVVNAGKIVAMQGDAVLAQSVLDADIINADEMSVVWASRFSGKALPSRVAGIDLMLELVKRAHKCGYRCCFFGAKQEVIEKVVTILQKSFHPI